MKKLLFLGQYEIKNLNSAPKIRTYNMFESFKSLVDTDFITGTRKSRRFKLLKYILSGKIFKVDAIYLESATSTSMETDILILLIAKLLKIPIGIYIRDAFPLFNLTDNKSIKNKILIIGWYVSIWFYKITASVLFFPTEGLAKSFRCTKEYKLLPPGGIDLGYQEFLPEEKGILYSGGIGPLYGISSLIEAVEKIYDKHKDVKLYIVCRKEDINDSIKNKIFGKDWIILKHVDFNEMIKLRKKIYLSVIPLVDDPYSDIALPVKLFDYMSLGKPIVATNRIETVKFFSLNNIGLISKCSPEDLSEKISFLLDNFSLSGEISINIYKILLEKHLWIYRAQDVIKSLSYPKN